MQAAVKRSLKAILFFAGIGFLVYFIAELGWTNIAFYLGKMQWEFFVVLLISLAWYLLNCLAWEQFLESRKHKISLSQLFKIKLAGEAINTVTPVSWMGGDPLRIAFMRRFYSASEGAASVILDRTIHSVASVILMGTGFMLALFALNLSAAMMWSLFGVVIAVLLMLVIAIRHQHRGLLNSILYLLDRIKLGHLLSTELREKLRLTDTYIQHYLQSKRRQLILAILYHVAGRLLGVLEIYAIAFFLHTPLSLINAYLLAVLSALINLVFVLVPGGMGVMEGAYGGMFHLLSLDPAAGVSLQLVRRIRTFFWIAVGFLFISLHRKQQPPPLP